MKKNILYYLLLIIFIVGCHNKQEGYPKEILNRNLTTQFDYAKWELYMLYLKCIPKEKSEELLSHDFDFLGLDTLIKESITIYFASSILEKIASESDCVLYNGIGFNNQGNINTLSWGSSVTVDYSRIGQNEENKIIHNFLIPNKSILTPWLKQQLEKR